MIWDLQGEQGPCPCACPGCASTLISGTLCPPIVLLLLLPAVPSLRRARMGCKGSGSPLGTENSQSRAMSG